MMKKRTLIFFLVLTIGVLTYLKAESFQIENIWKTLRKVTWKYKYNSELKAKVPYPNFSSEIEALQDKEISITGFVVPVEMYSGEGKEYLILSAFPASSCFFCGGSGPESVIEIYPKSQKSFSTMQRTVTFKGRLELNPDDFSHLIYILRDAEFVP